MNLRAYIFLGFCGCLLLLLAGCAADRKGPVANVYHNVTARYNAYFLAKEKMKEVEDALAQAQERNFNKLLYIFPSVDTTVVSSVKPQLEDVMKKASIAIDRHKHSRWVDDSYILVGKVRFYQGEFKHAVETFKYVNVKSEDDDARHQALIQLMRTFVDYQELNNAKAVADYLRKENLNNENLKDLNLVKAYYFQQREDWEQMIAALEEAAPESKKKEGRARYYFLLGQLYQQSGQDEKAYASFRKSLKSNPDYELSFYARLNMAQVFNLAEEKDEKQIRRYFSKLLRDKKNKEYRDKIFFEIGNFEARQENLEAAIDNYEKSIQASIDNTRQKSYAYLKLAEIYYDTYNNYELAKNYYDSTLNTLPQDELIYPKVEQRQKVLTELVNNLNTIQEQDSLLHLAQLDSASLMVFLEEVVQKEQEEQERQERLAKANKPAFNQVNVRPGFNTVQDKFGLTPTPTKGGEWYFYNASMQSIGQSEFIKNWGDRPLQDHWRRFSSNQSENTNVVTQQQQIEQFEDEAAPVISVAEQLAQRKQQLFSSLPLSPEQQNEAYAKVETAYYNLGRIYNFELEEFKRSIQAYDTLLQRFPESEYRPEVLYQLYLLLQESNPALAQQYKEELISKYPASIFAKVAQNPNFKEESDQAAAMLKKVYAQAYSWYENGAYQRADSLLHKNLQQFPKNSFSDHLRLLQILVTGKTDGVARYQYELKRFTEQTENERLLSYANELLQASYDFSENNAKRLGTRFKEDFEQPHYFLLIYENEKKLADALITAIDSFNLNQHPKAKLSATNLILKDKTAMVYVSQFPDRGDAIQYFRDFERNKPLPKESENAKINFFVITKDNFQILYDSKDLNSYLKFFNKFYN